MKKLVAIFAVLLFAAPAFAADWAFYGSERFATFYTVRDRSNFDNEDTDLNHSMQGNSRIGANVKADKIQGAFELALRGTDTGDNTVNTRQMWGQWNFGDKMYLKIGKYQNIIDQTDVSNQVYAADNDLTGLALQGRRTTQIELGIGNFQLAFVQPTTSNTPVNGTAWANTVTNDAKTPKLEATYTLPIGSMFKIKPAGGFQWLETSQSGSSTTDKEDLYSYVAGLGVYSTIGAFYGKVSGWYGQNVRQANWDEGGGVGQVDNYAGAAFVNGDLKDTKSYGVGGEVGLNFTDTIAFATGAGIRQDDNDAAASGKEYWYNVYVQMTYKFAPGAKITPEVGYIANQDDFTTGRSGGNDWYAGLQWRIDF